MPEIIRLGDPTSHGGKVIEGSASDICHNKPIAYQGHKVYCPKCNGTFPIVEGALTTSLYGKGVALAGMKTSCGATLIATQFTDVVEWGGGAGSGQADAGATNYAEANSAARSKTSESNFIEKVHDSQVNRAFDEQVALLGGAITGLPYVIETRDGRRFQGRAAVEGILPRIDTDKEDEYIVYWGDEALAKIAGAS